ncbi:hypothetical protein KBA39_08010, partial [Myxococcota bacterium]|nr:hypothetical protein [Myxococcota bacterium]
RVVKIPVPCPRASAAPMAPTSCLKGECDSPLRRNLILTPTLILTRRANVIRPCARPRPLPLHILH